MVLPVHLPTGYVILIILRTVGFVLLLELLTVLFEGNSNCQELLESAEYRTVFQTILEYSLIFPL